MRNRIIFGSAGAIAISFLGAIAACSSSTSSGTNVCGSEGCDASAPLTDQWAPFGDGPGIGDSPTFDATAPFAITLAPATLGVPVGGSVHFNVTIARAPGFTGSVTLALEHLPAHVASFSAAVAPQDTVGELTVSADAMATLGTTKVRVGAGGGSGFTYSDLSLSVNPPSGTLDTSFGSSGTVSTDLGGCDARGIALAPDGTFVVASCAFNGAKYAVTFARFTAAGALDTTFATSGKVAPDFTGPSLRPLALLRQPDGSLVVAGEAAPSYYAFVARYLANGTIDPAFATAGVNVLSQAGPAAVAKAMALQPDGKIVIAGNSQSSSLGVALARVGTNGVLDPTFGSAGAIPVVYSADNDVAAAVALQSDGSIVVGGRTAPTGTPQFFLSRYSALGFLDASFGTAGRVVLPVTGGAISAIYVQPDGAIVASGYAYEVTGGASFRVARVTKTGALDVTFADHGLGKVHFAEMSADYPGALAPAADGKLIIGGGSFPTALPEVMALTRVTANGGLDTSFGTAGLVTFSDPAASVSASAIAIQPDGRLLVAGGTSASATQVFVARFWP